MSSDYTKSTLAQGSNYPIAAIDAQEWTRYEPLITPTQLVRRFLFGIPLVAAQINPLTKKPDILTNEDLKDFIIRAVGMAELDTQVSIFAVKHAERQDFDKPTIENYGHIRLNHRPILSVDKVVARPGSANLDLYQIPNEWINPGYFTKGVIHITPLMPALMTNSIPATGNANGIVFMHFMRGRGWIPAFWTIEYTAGFQDGAIPRIINELVGMIAAVEVLSLLQNTHSTTSNSLSLDGASESQSGPGNQKYDPLIKRFQEKIDKLVGKIKALYGNKFVMSNI